MAQRTRPIRARLAIGGLISTVFLCCVLILDPLVWMGCEFDAVNSHGTADTPLTNCGGSTLIGVVGLAGLGLLLLAASMAAARPPRPLPPGLVPASLLAVLGELALLELGLARRATALSPDLLVLALLWCLVIVAGFLWWSRAAPVEDRLQPPPPDA